MRALSILSILFLLVACQPPEKTIYISSSGHRLNSGSKEEPVETFEQAQRIAGEFQSEYPKRAVRMIFMDDTVFLNHSLLITPQPQDSIRTGKLTISGKDKNQSLISGGKLISNWTVTGDLWETHLTGIGKVEQLYINGDRAVRARIPNVSVTPQRWYIDSVFFARDRGEKSILQADLWIDEKQDMPDLSAGGGFEVVIFKDWATIRKQVAAYDPISGRYALKPPYIFFDGNYNGLCAPYVKKFSCYLEGHPAFIDHAGEWAFNETTGVLYYKPKPGQEPASTVCIVPVLQNLLQIQGENGKPVSNIVFENLCFAHEAYQLPIFGHDGRQACFFYSEGTGIKADQAILPSAIEATWAENLSFINCTVEHTGGNGIFLSSGSSDIDLEACLLTDIGGNGLMIGMAKDPGEGSAELVRNVRFRNGEVSRAGRHFDSAVGIWLGFCQECAITGSSVYDLPYTGISVGWQWNPIPSSAGNNLIADNQIHDVMQMLGDGGGIYTLGNQPGSIIRNNTIYDILRSELNHASPNNGMFIDEGSKNYLVEGNHISRVAHTCIRGHRAAGVLLKNNTFERGEFPAISHTPPYGNMIFSDRDSTIVWPNPGWPAEWGYADSVVAFTMEGNTFK